MNNELVSRVCEYGEISVVNKVVEIKISSYTFYIQKDLVKVHYLKPLENEFVFDLNKHTETIYQTQYGSIHFEVSTSKIEYDGKCLDLHYSLYQAGEKQADYRIILKYL